LAIGLYVVAIIEVLLKKTEKNEREGDSPPKKLVLWAILLVVLIFNAVFGWLYYDRIVFPDKAEIDSTFDSMKNISSKDHRVEELYQILNRSKGTYDSETDEVVEYLASMIAEYYQKTHDNAALIAMDRLELDGGFANIMCGVYSTLLSEAAFLKRIQSEASAREAAFRCVGLSMSQEQLETGIEGNGNVLKD
jgi:hypothetical protein